MSFTNLVARWPGSVHDSRIFENSRLFAYFENERPDGWMLGDAGYPCRSYLLTPLQNPQTPAERKYNKCHAKTRNVIERTFGAWKRRFPCLTAGLKVSMQTTLTVIVACAVLWNYGRQEGSITNEEIEEIEEEEDENNIFAGAEANLEERTAARKSLIERYFYSNAGSQ